MTFTGMHGVRTSARALAVAAMVAIAPGLVRAQDITAPRAADNAHPVALDEAVRMARRNSPAAVQARGQERTSRAAVRSAYGAFIPSFNVSVGRTRRFSDDVGRGINVQTGEPYGAPTTYNSGFTANVTLFDGGRNLYELGTARANVTSAEASQVASEFTIALDVSQQYYNALAARESEIAARGQLSQAEQQHSSAVRRVRAGAATRSDSLRTLILVGNARLAILQGQADLRAANATLTRLIGSPITVTADLADTVTAAPVPLDTTRLAELALNGPAVREAQAAHAAARATRRASRSSYLPTISASYSRGGSGIDERFGFSDKSYRYTGQFGVTLSYPLFNGFSREEAVVRADVAEDNAEAAYRDARLLAQQSLVQYVDALATADARVAVQRVSVTAAQEDLRVQQQRYAAGASTLLDVLTSQTSLNDAQTALIQARFDARVARARLEALIGQRLTAVQP